MQVTVEQPGTDRALQIRRLLSLGATPRGTLILEGASRLVPMRFSGGVARAGCFPPVKTADAITQHEQNQTGSQAERNIAAVTCRKNGTPNGLK
jgi:hypothetical protein